MDTLTIVIGAVFRLAILGAVYYFAARAFRNRRIDRERLIYCESPVTSTNFGDAEHYRPKKAVTDKKRDTVQYGVVPHPGYYWLAYDWRNLLPALRAMQQRRRQDEPVSDRTRLH